MTDPSPSSTISYSETANVRPITGSDERAARFPARYFDHEFGGLTREYEHHTQFRAAVFELIADRLSRSGVPPPATTELFSRWGLPKR